MEKAEAEKRRAEDEKIRQAFDMFDLDKDGKISNEELRTMFNRRLASLGRAGRMTAEDLQQLISQ